MFVGLIGPNMLRPLHGTTTMSTFVDTYCCLKPVKLLGPYKRTQQCWPTTLNNVVTCFMHLQAGTSENGFHVSCFKFIFQMLHKV